MFSPSHLKTMHPLQVFSVKSSSSSSSTLSSTKLKSLISTLIFSHMCRLIRALSKVKSIILRILRDSQAIHSKNKKKLILGSFRLHYNWCSSKSSHVLPVPAPVYEGLPSNHFYFDSKWDTVIPEAEQEEESELAGYLQWLEEKVQDEDTERLEIINDNIDALAEMFIANCHEKFKLEKQESDRRFQEMLARSI